MACPAALNNLKLTHPNVLRYGRVVQEALHEDELIAVGIVGVLLQVMECI